MLLHVYATFAVGGPQVRFAAIANHFGRRWRHVVVAMDGNTTCRERLSPDLDVLFPDVDIRKGDTIGNAGRFRRFLKELQPSLLITSNWGSIEWAMANLPGLVRHVHIEDGFGPEERATQISRRVWTRRLLLRRSKVVVPSRTLWRLATSVWKLDAQRVRYVPNGIDLKQFNGLRRPGDDGPVIGTVAALRAEKNIGRLLRVFARLPDALAARLVIVGDGPERSALEAQSMALGIAERVRFAGHVAQPAGLYSEFDVFALTSDTEQMPLSVLEAMAAGLPVLATDVGDVRDMVADENRGLVMPWNEAVLAATMAELLGDPRRCVAIGQANRAKAEQYFNQETMFQTYARIFDGLP